MNCKAGDLAVIVGGKKQIGKTLTCIRLLTRDEHRVEDRFGPVWEVDREVSYETPRGKIWRNYCPDAVLLPINPKPDDEVVEQSEGELV